MSKPYHHLRNGHIKPRGFLSFSTRVRQSSKPLRDTRAATKRSAHTATQPHETKHVIVYRAWHTVLLRFTAPHIELQTS